MRFFYTCLCLVVVGNKLFAQYTQNGSAATTNCHCYILTPDQLNLSGSVWNNNKIDLRQSFDFQFNVFLGCKDLNGADGMVFTLQPISTSVGSTGGGMGFEGITPSIGVTLDTWQNAEYNDPAYDHIDFQFNGNLTHIGVPPPISATNDNVEDCNWHTLRIIWNAVTTTYTAYFDGQQRITIVNDLVNTTFKGDPLVFWGFTGSTGGSSNLQQFCTALNPIFKLLPTQKRCIGEPVQFFNATISFAPLFKTFWDFGDGSPIDSINVNPIHSYLKADDYFLIQTVVGIDGCTEINKQLIRVGSKPVAAFAMNNACADSAVNFKDASTVQVGTINTWNWDLSSGLKSTEQNPVQSYPIYKGSGSLQIKLSVKTLEGCSSDTVINFLSIYPRPIANFTNKIQACLNSGVAFLDSSYFDKSGNTFNATINRWNWNFGNGQLSAVKNNTISFANSGDNSVSLSVKSDQGCGSLPISKTIHILTRPTAYFTSNTICEKTVTFFKDSSYTSNGNNIKTWWWNLGDGGATLTTNAVSTTYSNYGNVTIQLAVSDSNNCLSDTLKKIITISSKPFANFGAAAPICEGSLISFTDSSTSAEGAVNKWKWNFDNNDSSATQNSQSVFTKGNHVINLLVKNIAGCSSDVASKNIFINASLKPGFNFASVCRNAVADFTGMDFSGETITAWKWNFGDCTLAAMQNSKHTYKTVGTYAVKLKVLSAAGCSTVKDSSIIVYGTNIFAGNDTIAAPNQPIQLQANGGFKYQWSPASGLNNDTIANPVATNFTDITYYLKASTPIGCDSYDTLNIKIYAGPQLYLPTAFSPNGDGLNDVFKVFPVGMVQFDLLTIYDRYGKIIFAAKNVSKGWDGTFKNSLQNAGTYIWTVSGTDYKGNKIIRKGSVVLVR